MKYVHIPLEYLIPLCIPVIAGLVLWALKAWVKSLKNSIIEEVKEEQTKQASRITVNEGNIKRIDEQTGFLTKYLLERKS